MKGGDDFPRRENPSSSPGETGEGGVVFPRKEPKIDRTKKIIFGGGKEGVEMTKGFWTREWNFLPCYRPSTTTPERDYQSVFPRGGPVARRGRRDIEVLFKIDSSSRIEHQLDKED